MNIVKKEVEIEGKILSLETGRYARQADGAVMARYGDTMVLVTAVSERKEVEGLDYFPLQVEYREKLSAAGKFPGGFIKREGRPSEKEILSARLIDRPIRPLFPDGYKNETQIVANVYSFDQENDPDVLAAIAASAALTISDIPFHGPIAQVRVGRIDGNFVINPTVSQVEESDLELIVAGTEDSIMMVEGEALEVPEADLIEALRYAQDALRKIVGMQKELAAEIGKTAREFTLPEIPAELKADVDAAAREPFKELINTVMPKKERTVKTRELTNSIVEQFEEKYPEQEKMVKEVIHDIEKELMRKMIVEEGKRVDGRKTDEVRPITVELGVLPRTHGSALFTRGETQSLTTLTLGTKSDEQIIDGLYEESSKRFLLHYNFPPFSVGECGRMTGVGRREIGHGNLAERSLKKQLPLEDDFSYTMRLISDILESNGSSSMATVCAGSLALMDAGVPVKKAVAGIAMGLIKEPETQVVLSDILGSEDHLGDMDFKIAGTADGVTAVQMDIKVEGISFEIMERALDQAKAGRLHILGIMAEAISEPRADLSPYAPRIERIQIDTEYIGTLIGPSGKTVQGMQRDFGVEIHIEESGLVSIASPNLEGIQQCIDHIKLLVAEPEVNEVYEGEIVKILDFGALVEILPGKSGLMHISEIDHKRVNKVEDYFQLGDKVTVKLLKIDNGKYSLSRKALIENPNKDKEGGKSYGSRGGNGGRHHDKNRGDRNRRN